MNFSFSKEFKAGLAVALIAVAMYWLVFFLKGKDIFSRFNTYYTAYESVEGLNTTAVFIRGFKVGTVERITYNQQQDRFEVSLNIESKYQIPANSIAQIYSTDLLGTKAIRIMMGNSPQFLAHKDSLTSGFSEDILAYLSQELPLLKEQVSALLTGMEATIDHVNTLLGDENQIHLQRSLADLSVVLHNFKSLSAYLNTEIPQIHSILGNFSQLAEELGASSENMSATLTNLRIFSDTLKQANVADLIQNLDLLVVQLQDPNNSIGQLLNNDQVHQKITKLLESIDSLVSNISQNPKKYLKISVF